LKRRELDRRLREDCHGGIGEIARTYSDRELSEMVPEDGVAEWRYSRRHVVAAANDSLVVQTANDGRRSEMLIASRGRGVGQSQ